MADPMKVRRFRHSWNKVFGYAGVAGMAIAIYSCTAVRNESVARANETDKAAVTSCLSGRDLRQSIIDLMPDVSEAVVDATLEYYETPPADRQEVSEVARTAALDAAVARIQFRDCSELPGYEERQTP